MRSRSCHEITTLGATTSDLSLAVFSCLTGSGDSLALLGFLVSAAAWFLPGREQGTRFTDLCKRCFLLKSFMHRLKSSQLYGSIVSVSFLGKADSKTWGPQAAKATGQGFLVDLTRSAHDPVIQSLMGVFGCLSDLERHRSSPALVGHSPLDYSLS